MKAVFNKIELDRAVEAAAKVIENKPQMPVLSGIRITASEGGCIVEASRITLSIKYDIDGDVTENGAICVEAKIFGSIIKKLPDGRVEISSDGKSISVNGGRSRFNISGFNPLDFPEIKDTEGGYTFSMSAAEFDRVTRKAAPFTAVSEGKRPVHMGVLFDMRDGELNIAASDGRRLACIPANAEVTNDGRAVIPSENLKDFPKRFEDKEITIACGRRDVTVDYGKYKIKSVLLDGEFLDYKKVISAVNPVCVIADKKQISESLERAMILISEDVFDKTENKAPAILDISEKGVGVSCVTSKGKAADMINADVSGGPLRIGFNCRFLHNAVNACDSGKIKMEFSAPTRGCFIRNADNNDKSVYMVLPVRLYD